MEQILAAIVLYQLNAEESVAFHSYRSALEQCKTLRATFRLHVFDNSPAPHRIESDLVCGYVHDGTNPGLAAPYNHALKLAREAGISWLLVLDQDTAVTLPYLQEAARLAGEQVHRQQVIALAPKLVQHGKVTSPHTLLSLNGTQEIPADRAGVATQELHVFNSGAVLRVAALEAIGGFPSQYPLDFLDHATFRLLQQQGHRVFLMDSCLDHDLSLIAMTRNIEEEVPARLRQIYRAERQFYREMGTPAEKVLHRLRLLYLAAKNVRAGARRRSLLFLRLALGMES